MFYLFISYRNAAVSPIDQLLLALRFYATGSMLITVGDFVGVHKSTACKILAKVTRAIALLRPMYISFPSTAEGRRVVQEGFYALARFPRVLGALDCTHVKIQSPGNFMLQ